MKLALQHETRYEYDRPVFDSINEAYLCPSSNAFQICHQFDLDIFPGSASVLRRIDFYTNQVHHFEVLEAHDCLEVIARSEVETFADSRTLDTVPSFDQLKGLERDDQFYDFLSESARVQLVPMVVHEARELRKTASSVAQAIDAIMRFVHSGFRYVKGVTRVETDVSQVMTRREGVCQDFAHVMIALCRALGIPARYVSGYVYVDPPRATDVNDNTASHAWVDCYFPDLGWIGFDPTHNRRSDERYVRVAVGRDYTDVRPVSGTHRGQGRATLSVTVTVKRI